MSSPMWLTEEHKEWPKEKFIEEFIKGGFCENDANILTDSCLKLLGRTE